MKYIERQLQPVSSCMELLPIHERKMLENLYLETNILTKTISNTKHSQMVPEKGRISWIIGAHGNQVPKSMIEVASYAVMLKKPAAFQYIDFSNNSVEGKTVYRFDHIVKEHEKTNPDTKIHHAAKVAQLALHTNLNAWKNIYGVWAKYSKLSFLKTPLRNTPEDTLMVSMNPRKAVISELVERAQNNRIIIADTECDSIYNLGSRAHFGIDNRPRSVATIRNLLKLTDKIMEQRFVYLEPIDKHVLLCRIANVDHEALQLVIDETVGIKQIITAIASKMPSWQEAAQNLSNELKLNTANTKLLLDKALRLDQNSEKAMRDYVRHEAEMGHVITKEEYIGNVLAYFAEEHEYVIKTYEDSFQLDASSYQNNSLFVMACSQRDYLSHHLNRNFIFPELAYSKQAQDALSMAS